jgi:hypothetical protein
MLQAIVLRNACVVPGVSQPLQCITRDTSLHSLPLDTLFPAPPRIRIPRQYEDGLIFEKDEVIRLKVSVAGRPLPRTTWYHDGQSIPFGGRYEVSNTDRSSGLRISEAQRGDRGEYQVRATSRLGEDVVSFLVTVTGELLLGRTRCGRPSSSSFSRR